MTCLASSAPSPSTEAGKGMSSLPSLTSFILGKPSSHVSPPSRTASQMPQLTSQHTILSRP